MKGENKTTLANFLESIGRHQPEGGHPARRQAWQRRCLCLFVLHPTTRGTGVIALQEEQTMHPYAPPLLPLAEIAQPTLSSWTFFSVFIGSSLASLAEVFVFVLACVNSPTSGKNKGRRGGDFARPRPKVVPVEVSLPGRYSQQLSDFHGVPSFCDSVAKSRLKNGANGRISTPRRAEP